MGETVKRAEAWPAPEVEVGSVYELVELDGGKLLIRSRDPESVRNNNAKRAGSAAVGLLAYAEHTRGVGNVDESCLGELLGDLLGDLRHLADRCGLSYDARNGHGALHYEDELRGV